MKLIISLLSVVVLLLTLMVSTTSAKYGGITSTDTAVVYDVDHKRVEAGVSYYILPLIRGNGGGLALSSRNKSAPCPLNVIQENIEVSRGMGVTFYPVNPKDKVIKLSTDQNFEFDASTVCVQSTVWRLGEFDETTERRYVVTGGEKGNPGLGTVGNWFKIDKAAPVGSSSSLSAYKLVHCPSVCSFCKVICKDVGVFADEGGNNRWIGLLNDETTEKPLLVIFKRAD